jgi:SAM-dependent methyltransferase
MEKLQAIFRGKRAREVQVKRYEEGKKISCPFLSSNVITGELLHFVEREGLITKDDIVHDIGCGNGDIMVALSKKFGCHTFGLDIDPVLIATANRKASEEGVSELVHARVGEAENVNLKEPQQATVIYLFLIPHCLIHVSKTILASCPKGTTVIAYKYQMPAEDGWVPAKTFPCADVLKPGEQEKVYLYFL